MSASFLRRLLAMILPARSSAPSEEDVAPSEEDVAPSEEDVERARKALRGLLLSMFSADELRRFVSYGPRGADLRPQLPERAASAAELSEAVVRFYEEHDLIDDEFFARLRGERPRRAGDIEPVARTWADLKK